MSVEKLMYREDKFCVVYNERTVELDIFATAYYYHSPQTFWEPAYDETEIDEIFVKNAHYVDNNVSIPADDLEDVISDKLLEMDGENWSICNNLSYERYKKEFEEAGK